MKLTNKLAAITAASMLSFAGVGFAAWTFNKDASISSTANIAVLAETELGTLTITTTNLYIILDQSGIYYATDAAGENPITQLVANYTAVADGTYGANMDIDFTLTWSIGSVAWTNYVSGLTSVSLGTVTVDNGSNELLFTLPTLTYTANKPSTKSEYDTMKEALNGKSLTITITADAAADNA